MSDSASYDSRHGERKETRRAADPLWRIKKNPRLPREKRLKDGSYLSRGTGDAAKAPPPGKPV